MTQQRTCDRETLFFSAGDFNAAFSDQSVEPFVGASEQAVTGSLSEHGHTFIIGCCGIHKEQVFADASGKELRILSNQADTFTQTVEVNVVNREAVVSYVARLR